MVDVSVNKTAWFARVRATVAALFIALVMTCGVAVPAVFAEDAAGKVTVSVVGVENADDPQSMGVTWVGPVTSEFAEGATAWDAFKPALDEAGCTYDAQDSEYGIFIQSITSPDGMMLEGTDTEPYSYWSFLVNGEMASVGVSGYELQDGDTIELVYYANGEAPTVGEQPQVDATASTDGEDATDADSTSDNSGLIAGGVAVAVVAVVAVLVVKSRKKSA